LWRTPVKELGRIAFADIRKAVTWHSPLVKEEDNPEGGDILVIRHIFVRTTKNRYCPTRARARPCQFSA
jgi:hypothetical protein